MEVRLFTLLAFTLKRHDDEGGKIPFSQLAPSVLAITISLLHYLSQLFIFTLTHQC